MIIKLIWRWSTNIQKNLSQEKTLNKKNKTLKFMILEEEGQPQSQSISFNNNKAFTTQDKNKHYQK